MDIIESAASKVSRIFTMGLIEGNIEPRHRASHRVHPKLDRMYSSDDILELEEKTLEDDRIKNMAKLIDKERKNLEKEDIKRRKEEAAGMFCCRGTKHEHGKNPVWRNAGNWLWCEYCNSFGLCPVCIGTCKNIMNQHEDNHKRNGDLIIEEF